MSAIFNNLLIGLFGSITLPVSQLRPTTATPTAAAPPPYDTTCSFHRPAVIPTYMYLIESQGNGTT